MNSTAFLWNETWVAREHVGWVVGLLASTLALYAGSVTLVVFLYQWYTPTGVECTRNVWLITTSLVPCIAFTALCVHPIGTCILYLDISISVRMGNVTDDVFVQISQPRRDLCCPPLW